jgi:hypothetical protein
MDREESCENGNEHSGSGNGKKIFASLVTISFSKRALVCTAMNIRGP